VLERRPRRAIAALVPQARRLGAPRRAGGVRQSSLRGFWKWLQAKAAALGVHFMSPNSCSVAGAVCAGQLAML